jgi:hypothetical protein
VMAVAASATACLAPFGILDMDRDSSPGLTNGFEFLR